MNDDETLKRLMFVDEESFIDEAHYLFLGRIADETDRSHCLARLRRGYGRALILIEISKTREACEKMLSIPEAVRRVVETGRHHYILDELLNLDGAAFIRFAFLTILRREPDASGWRVYSRLLRNGAARLLVLMYLRTSEEGREVNVEVPGLDRAIRPYLRAKWPVVGKLLLKVGFMREVVSIESTIRRIGQQLDYFRGTALGEVLANRQVVSRNACFESLREYDRQQFSAQQDVSVKIIGNPAVPGQVWSDRENIKRIVILKLDHMGDFFVSVRPMTMLREAWPDAHLTLVCGPWNISFAQQLGIFDKIVPYQFFAEKTGEEAFNWNAEDWNTRCEGVADLDLGPCDIAIDLRHDSDTRPCLMRIDSRYRIGFASPGGELPPTPPLDLFLLEIPPEHREQLHAESRLVALVSLTIETFRPPSTHPIRRLVQQEAPMATPFGGERDYVVIAPGAGSPNRTWSAESFALLMDRILSQTGLGLVIVGGASEADINSRIADKFSAAECIDLTGCSISALPYIVDRAALFIGNDTGGGHLAALLGTPTLSLYGGVSDPRVWQPIGPKVSILHSRTPCAYCHINLRKDCLYDVRCMTEIEVGDALTEALKLLDRWGSVSSGDVRESSRVKA